MSSIQQPTCQNVCMKFCIRPKRLVNIVVTNNPNFSGLTQPKVISQSCYKSQVSWQGSSLQSQSRVQNDRNFTVTCASMRTIEVGRELSYLACKVSSSVIHMTYAYTVGTNVSHMAVSNRNKEMWSWHVFRRTKAGHISQTTLMTTAHFKP